MKKSGLIVSLILSLFLNVASFAQTPAKPGQPPTTTGERFAAEKELANSVLAAHGGEKLRAMKTLVVNGPVDVTTSAIAQAIPATFIMIISGEKYRLEINNPFQPLKQIFDGTQTSNTIRGGFNLPPINRLGFPLLPKLGQPGFVVTSLPEGKKKKSGFRMTSPEGFYTDFYIDEKTKLIKGYDSIYEIDGRKITTSVEVDKFRVVEGVTVPEKYVQRFDMDQIVVYANFKAKDILVNSAVADDVFAIGN